MRNYSIWQDKKFWKIVKTIAFVGVALGAILFGFYRDWFKDKEPPKSSTPTVVNHVDSKTKTQRNNTHPVPGFRFPSANEAAGRKHLPHIDTYIPKFFIPYR